MNTLEEKFEVTSFDEDDVHRIVSLVDKYQMIVIRVFNNMNICRHNNIISLRDYESINEDLNEIIDNCNSIIDSIYFISDKTVQPDTKFDIFAGDEVFISIFNYRIIYIMENYILSLYINIL